MIEFQAEDASRMLRNRKEADIVQILDQTIIRRLEELKVAEPYNAKRLRTHYRHDALLPCTYREDLDFPTFAQFAEKDMGLPGVHLNVKPVRKYVYHAMAAQILGYVGAPEDTNALLDRKDFDFYEPDIQGRTNLEYLVDGVLKKKVIKTKTVKPDIRPEADDHRALSRVQPVQPEKQRGFFDFWKRKPKEEKPSRPLEERPQDQKKKKRFLFF
jgi:cell division protein FtsI/penicillin-binding protein 2